MKRIQLLVQCLLLTFAMQAMAAQTGRDCEIKAKQVAPDKRDAFLQSCLAQTSAPANVQEIAQQNKRLTCEQNAKNLKLSLGNKSGYVEECMRKNEAAIAAKKLNTPQSDRPDTYAAKATSKPAAAGSDKPVSKKTGQISQQEKLCFQQAKKQGLNGSARKQFVKDCRKG